MATGNGQGSDNGPSRRVADPSSYQQAERAGRGDEMPRGPEPAHMQAAAQVAGMDRPSAGAQSIGVGAGAAAATQGYGRSEGSARIDPLRAFDNHRPPEPELINDCVHCGFCLPTCPTYLLWGEEMDSPRGRIYLMRMASEGEIGMTDEFVRHMDLCLGCMACVTACPSGVQYEKLIEIDARAGRAALRALVLTTMPSARSSSRSSRTPSGCARRCHSSGSTSRAGSRRLLRSPLAQRLIPARLLGMEAVLAAGLAQCPDGEVLRVHPGAAATARRRVGLLSGCVQRVFFDPVNAATIRVLTAEGCDVVVPEEQGCCGALNFHAGREEGGLERARRLIDTFERAEVDTIVVNAAGCGSTLKEYGYLLRDDPAYAERARQFSERVRDISELLAELEPVAPRGPVPLRVAYHDACHLGHAQGMRRQPRAVLRGIPGLELLDIPEADICCGSAGIYNLVQPDAANDLGARKARNILDTNPELIATANPGCLLQIGAALGRLDVTIPTVHPVEIVDASIRGIIPAAWFGRVAAVAPESMAAD